MHLKISKHLILILSFAFVFSNCLRPLPLETIANNKFYSRQYVEAQNDYKQLVNDSYNNQNINYILFLMNYALLNYYSGNYDEAYKAFWSAYLTNENQLSWGEKLQQVFKKQSKRIYKLKKRELMLLHYYLGICFLVQNDFNKARIEFGKVYLIEEQKPKLPLVSFMEGQCYELMQNYEEALISYETTDQISLDKNNNRLCSFQLLSLASVYNKLNDIKNVHIQLDKYNAFEHKNQGREYLINDINGFDTKLIITIDVCDLRDIGFCKVFSDKTFLGKAYLFDIFKPGKNAGEFIREILKELPLTIFYIFEALAGIKEEDPDKYWYYAPQGTFLLSTYLPNGAKEIVVEFYDREGKCKADFLYDLRSSPVTRINNILFLPIRYHHIKFAPYYTYNFSEKAVNLTYDKFSKIYIRKDSK